MNKDSFEGCTKVSNKELKEVTDFYRKLRRDFEERLVLAVEEFISNYKPKHWWGTKCGKDYLEGLDDWRGASDNYIALKGVDIIQKDIDTFKLFTSRHGVYHIWESEYLSLVILCHVDIKGYSYVNPYQAAFVVSMRDLINKQERMLGEE